MTATTTDNVVRSIATSSLEDLGTAEARIELARREVWENMVDLYVAYIEADENPASSDADRRLARSDCSAAILDYVEGLGDDLLDTIAALHSEATALWITPAAAAARTRIARAGDR